MLIAGKHGQMGRGYLALFGYSENLYLLLRKWWSDFLIVCGNVPWVTLCRIPSSHVDWSKNMAARGGAILNDMAIVTTSKIFSSESVSLIFK